MIPAFEDAESPEPPCRGVPVGPSPAGCRFVVMESTATGGIGPAQLFHNRLFAGCHALLVSNPSPEPARLRLRFKDREEDAAPFARLAKVAGRDVEYEPLTDGALAPRQTAVVSAFYFYPDDERVRHNVSICPVKAFVESAEPWARGDVVTSGIELISDTPVVVAQAVQFQKDAWPVPDEEAVSPAAQSGSTLFPAFPVEAWDSAPVETGIFKPGLPKELVNPDSDGNPIRLPTLPIRTVVLAAFDGTTVLLPRPDGPPRTVRLQRGEVFAHDPNDAMIGRVISANKPIGVVSYGPAAFIPWDYPIGPEPDGFKAYQPALPARLWGSEFVAVRHGDRWSEMPERPPWRLIGGADRTLLTYEPYHPDGAPDRLERGELAVFFADAPFVVRSQDEQHPFYVGAHMTGSRHQRQRFGDPAPIGGERGTPVSSFVLATSRWTRAYPFFALPRYPEHSLVVIRRKGASDVHLDCAGAIAGWHSVDATFEYARVSLTGHLFEPIGHPGGTCHAGNHWIESEDPFWATLWAWGNTDTTAEIDLGSGASYASPLLGAEVRALGEAH